MPVLRHLDYGELLLAASAKSDHPAGVLHLKGNHSHTGVGRRDCTGYWSSERWGRQQRRRQTNARGHRGQVRGPDAVSQAFDDIPDFTLFWSIMVSSG